MKKLTLNVELRLCKTYVGYEVSSLTLFFDIHNIQTQLNSNIDPVYLCESRVPTKIR